MTARVSMGAGQSTGTVKLQTTHCRSLMGVKAGPNGHSYYEWDSIGESKCEALDVGKTMRWPSDFDGRCEVYGEAGMRRANKEEARGLTRSEQACKADAQTFHGRAWPCEGIQNYELAMRFSLVECCSFQCSIPESRAKGRQTQRGFGVGRDQPMIARSPRAALARECSPIPPSLRDYLTINWCCLLMRCPILLATHHST